jgi:N-acetylmuramoyl-L-alanine amidase
MKPEKSYIPALLNRLIPLLLLSFAFSACGPTVYYVQPPDWKDAFKRDSAIASFRDALRSKTIFLDPGHGGDDRASVGPAGDVVEADVNLRVALALRDYLKQAGANVIMSRETDVTVPLEARAQQANANKADLFISIHHNAADNPYTNYTVTFYHSRPGESGYRPSSFDLARYIQRDLSYVMGTPGPLASFDGTMSDFQLYPGKGFSVLRNTAMTATMVECSFFSSAYEEQRLKNEEFNRIQAWGIFRGIGKYVSAGIPVLRYASPAVFAESQPKIEIEVSDRADILDESILVYINGKEQGFAYNRNTGRITVTPYDALAQGYHRLTAQVRNSAGNSSAPFELHFAVGKPPVSLRSTAEPALLPPDRSAFSMVTILALDSTGSSVPDGLPIRFRASTGLDTTLTLNDGLARVYLYPGRSERVTFEASNGPIRTEGVITTAPDAKYARGLVMSTEGKAIEGASIVMPGGAAVTTNDRGEYIIAGRDTEGMEVIIEARGYFGLRSQLTGRPVQDPVLLAPVANGALHGKPFVLNLATPAGSHEKDRIDFLAMKHLRQLLIASGANVTAPAIDTMLKMEDALVREPRASVVQFAVDAAGRTVTLRANAESRSRDLGILLQRIVPQFTRISLNRFVLRIPPRSELKGNTQIGIDLPVPSARTYTAQVAPLFSWNIAWALYSAILADAGYNSAGTKRVEVTVVDRQQKPAPFVLVELNHALQAMTDNTGKCVFPGVTITEDDVSVADSENFIIKGVSTEVLR